MFVGSFEHSLDEKGRLVLPSTYRHRLAEGGILAPWDRCLALWTPDEFERVAQVIKDKIAEGEEDEDVVQDVFRVFLADAWHVQPDSAGRVVIPADHRSQVGLRREAVVNGRLDHIEIWDRETWSAVQGTARGNVARVVKSMRL